MSESPVPPKIDIDTSEIDEDVDEEECEFCKLHLEKRRFSLFTGTTTECPYHKPHDASKLHVKRAIRRLSNYTPVVELKIDAEKATEKPEIAKMGTIMGVYLPCIQNIFGVLFFIRLAWIVGTAGVIQGFFVVLICCSVTFLTSISLSAIATNGIVAGGGPYYMISRNLGPELGGAIGILFYLGTSIAASMYILGAVEIFLLYLVPQARIVDDIYMCFRVFGTILLILLGLIVMAGVRVVNKFALPAVIIVVMCIFFTFVGCFVNIMGKDSLKFCMVGDRIVNLAKWADSGHGVEELSIACNSSYLEPIFCGINGTCDPYFTSMKTAGRVGPVQAISGMASGVITDALEPEYLDQNQILSDNVTSDPVFRTDTSPFYAYADIATSFMILVGVFFPSCTGIMAGSNRSGDLRDASLSIPRGTIAATTSTSVVYLLGVILFGASVNTMFLRDKFGEGAYGKLIIAELAVPHPVVILIGCFLSTVGAGMQSLTGAPRLLQAIAKDGVIPILSPFQKSSKGGEPIRAILLTLAICEVGVLVAQLESITALITQFFLMCYLSVNTACALQSLLKTPGWRPGFKYYSWVLSLLGSILCIAVMFISQWIFAIIAIIFGIIVYKYIQFSGAKKEWGDGLRGLSMSAARYALLNLEDKPEHTRNWRPQLLVMSSADPESEKDRHGRLLTFANSLKAGKGLTVLASVIEGDYEEKPERANHVKKVLHDSIKSYRIKGFCDVLICPNRKMGLQSLVQTSGLGSMRHNTIVLPWPDDWKEKEDPKICAQFVGSLRVGEAAKCAILVPINLDMYPAHGERVTGYMDVWWLAHDGGMMFLLPYLLRQNKTWRGTKLRMFAVAEGEDDVKSRKEELRKFLYQLRIEAEIDVMLMKDTNISEYTLERTRQMNRRGKILKEKQLSSKKRSKDKWMSVFNFSKQVSVEKEKLPVVKEEQKESETDLIPIIVTDHHETADSPPKDATNAESSEPVDAPQLPSKAPDTEATLEKPAVVAKPVIKNPLLSRVLKLKDKEGVEEKSAEIDEAAEQHNVKRMHLAIMLNELMRRKSADAQLIVINLPEPNKQGADNIYMEYVDALTAFLDRVLLIKGCGTDVVTIYS